LKNLGKIRNHLLEKEMPLILKKSRPRERKEELAVAGNV
jgi:hypothetical protein